MIQIGCGKPKVISAKAVKYQKLIVLLMVLLAFSLTVWLIQRHSVSRSLEKRLASIEQRINKIYSSTRPFPYRWIGAPYGLVIPASDSKVTLDDPLADLEQVEMS